MSETDNNEQFNKELTEAKSNIKELEKESLLLYKKELNNFKTLYPDIEVKKVYYANEYEKLIEDYSSLTLSINKQTMSLNKQLVDRRNKPNIKLNLTENYNKEFDKVKTYLAGIQTAINGIKVDPKIKEEQKKSLEIKGLLKIFIFLIPVILLIIYFVFFNNKNITKTALSELVETKTNNDMTKDTTSNTSYTSTKVNQVTQPKEHVTSYDTPKSTKIESFRQEINNRVKVPLYSFENYSTGKLSSTNELFVKFGSPTIVKNYKNNLGNSLLLDNTSSDMYDQIELKLGLKSKTYTINFDMFIPDNNQQPITLFLDTTKIRIISFHHRGKVFTSLMDGQSTKYRYKGVYPYNKWFNVNVTINLNNKKLIFTIDGQKVFSTKFVASGDNVEDMRLSVPKHTKVAIDNLQISKEIKDFYIGFSQSEEVNYQEKGNIVTKEKNKRDNKNKSFTWLNSDVNLGEIKLSAKKYADNIMELDISLENFSDYKKGWLSVSFPNLNSNAVIDIVRNNAFKSLKEYPRGNKIYNNKIKKNIKSRYVLVEGEGAQWQRGSSKSMKLHIKNFSKNKTLVLNIRGSFWFNKKAIPFPNIESSDFVEGQQGFLNYEVKIPIDSSTYVESSTFIEDNSNEVVENIENKQLVNKEFLIVKSTPNYNEAKKYAKSVSQKLNISFNETSNGRSMDGK